MRRRKGKYIECPNCKKVNYQPPHRLKKNGRFCNVKCKGEFMAKENKKNVFTVSCVACGKQFDRYYRDGIIPEKVFCNKQCQKGYHSPSKRKMYECKNCGKSFEDWAHLDGRKKYCSDECRKEAQKAPLNHILSRLHNSASRRNIDLNLTVQDLKEQWEKQKGICIYSKYPLVIPTQRKVKNGDINPFTYASVDRIDSSKGYVKGNIQFVSKQVNFLKGTLSHHQIVKFFDNYYEMRKMSETPITDPSGVEAKCFWL